ncbi:MAG: ABC transporter permease [Hyphomonadaceae bacterium]|nr:ABC transporter permease [Hyphomonadaceae bacterium]
MGARQRSAINWPPLEEEERRGSATVRLYRPVFQTGKHLGRALIREILAPYRETKLSILWALLTPVVPITAYAFLKIFLNAFPSSDGIDPAVYIAVGVTLWFWMRDIVFSGVNGLNRNKTMLAQSRFPLINTILIAQGNVIFEASIRIVFTMGLIAVFSSWSFAGILAAGVMMFVMAVMSHGIGLVLAVVCASSPDFKNLSDIVFRYAFFVSNVLFPLPKNDWTIWLYWLNPFAIAIDNTRYLIVYGEPKSWIEISALVVLALLVFMAGSRLFYFAKDQIRETLI